MRASVRFKKTYSDYAILEGRLIDNCIRSNGSAYFELIITDSQERPLIIHWNVYTIEQKNIVLNLVRRLNVIKKKPHKKHTFSSDLCKPKRRKKIRRK